MIKAWNSEDCCEVYMREYEQSLAQYLVYGQHQVNVAYYDQHHHCHYCFTAIHLLLLLMKSREQNVLIWNLSD